MSNYKAAFVLAALLAAMLPASAGQRYPAAVAPSLAKAGIVPAKLISRVGRRYLKPGHKTSTYRKKKDLDRRSRARY